MFEQHDSGDEDDSETHPDRWLRIMIAGWRYRIGKCIVVYPAEECEPLPDHDPGDEEPRLRMKSDLWIGLV